MRGLWLFCLAVLFIIIQATLGTQVIRGVAPSEQKLYSQPSFTCKDGSKNIPSSRINDDFCDCDDGSDEPATSACPNGKFFCQNARHQSKIITSSKVNDGICDCCDGSDEWSGRVNCVDNCYELGEESRATKRAELENYKKGLAVRDQYAEEGKQKREANAAKLVELRNKLKELKAEELVVTEQQKMAKERADKANELLGKYKSAEDEDDDEDEPDKPGEGDEQPEGDKETETEAKIEEKKEEAVLLERTPEVEAQLEQALKDVKQLEEIDERLDELREKISSNEREISDIEKEQGVEFGDDAYIAISGQSFELTVPQYTYHLRPFKEVKQGHTRLGDWSKWNADKTQMEYTGGERCWNGPDRSAKVFVSCGADNKLSDVQEPNKCEYTMRFMTPAACTHDGLARLEAELRQLENPGASAEVLGQQASHIL